MRSPRAAFATAAVVASTVAVALAAADLFRVAPALAGFEDPPAIRSVLVDLLMVGACVGVGIAGLGLGVSALAAALSRWIGGEGRWSRWIAAGAWAALPSAATILVQRELLRGTWVSQQAWTPWVRYLGAAVAVCVMTVAAHLLLGPLGAARSRRDRRDTRTRFTLLVAVAALLPGIATVDVVMLRGLYPAFHLALCGGFVIAAALLGVLLSAHAPRRLSALLAIIVVVTATVGGGAIAAGRLPGANPTRRSLLLEKAPFVSKLLGPLTPAVAEPPSSRELLAAARDLVATHVDTPPEILEAVWPRKQHRNLVLVTIDTVRADHVSAYGYARSTTPHLDRLAAEGVLFAKAYTQYPSSPLALASLFFGVYPSATGQAEDRRSAAPPPGPHETLAERFQARGYATGAVFALGRGFISRKFPYVPAGFERFQCPPALHSWRGDDVLRVSTEFLESLDERPFFLWVHLLDPHYPYEPPDRHRFGPDLVDAYDGEIAFADEKLGQLLEILRRREDWNRTVVVMHSDHGEALGDRGVYHHGSDLHEDQVRVPLVIRAPGVPPGDVEHIVELVDLVPTFIEIFDLPRTAGLHGQSLVPLLLPQPSGGALPVPPAVAYVELDSGPGRHLHAVRLEGWKLVQNLSVGTFHLYDMESPAGEQRDVWPTREHRRAWPLALLRTLRSLAGGDEPTLEREPSSASEIDVITSPIPELVSLLGTLTEEGAIDEAHEILGRFLALSEAPERLVLALRLAVLTPSPDFAARIIELARHAVPEVQVAACIALAAARDPHAVLVLEGLTDSADPRVRAAALAARALSGDDTVRDALQEIADSSASESKLLAIIGLAALGHADHHRALAALSIATSLRADHHRVILLAAVRSRDLRTLWTFDQFQRTSEIDVPTARLLIDAAKDFDRPLVLPTIRRTLSHPRPGVRELADLYLRPPLTTAQRDQLRQINSAELAAESRQPAATSQSIDALLETYRVIRNRGFGDWGLATSIWQLLVQDGRFSEAAEVLATLASEEPRPSGTRDCIQRLSRLAASFGAEPAPSVSLTLSDSWFRAGSEVQVTTLSLALDPEGGGVPGGLGPGAAGLLLTLSSGDTGQALAQHAFPLPAGGVLGGERLPMVLAFPVPAGARGSLRMSISLVWPLRRLEYRDLVVLEREIR